MPSRYDSSFRQYGMPARLVNRGAEKKEPRLLLAALLRRFGKSKAGKKDGIVYIFPAARYQAMLRYSDRAIDDRSRACARGIRLKADDGLDCEK